LTATILSRSHLRPRYFASTFCVASVAAFGDRCNSGVGLKVKGGCAAAVRCAARCCARVACAARRRLCCCVGARLARSLALCAVLATTLVIAHLNLSAGGALRRRDALGAAAPPEQFVAPYAVDVVTR
jgi:hypothetical protein